MTGIVPCQAAGASGKPSSARHQPLAWRNAQTAENHGDLRAPHAPYKLLASAMLSWASNVRQLLIWANDLVGSYF